MHEVAELRLGPSCRTRVWLSEKAQKEIKKFRKNSDPDRVFLKRLKRYAQNGFWFYEGDKQPIQHEWDDVYRIRPTDSLFRIIGFYENEDRAHYIAIDAFLKKGQQLTDGQRRRIDAVAAVKRDGDWKRKVEDVGYPRIAR